MNRLGGLARLAARHISRQSLGESAQQAFGLPTQALKPLAALSPIRSFATSADLTAEIEHATGLEKYELEGKAKGIDVWHEAWVDAPWGTETEPVEVTSAFEERIVGVPDPYDDSIIWWGTIRKGEGPKQIVEGGEFFVLKHIPEEGGHH